MEIVGIIRHYISLSVGICLHRVRFISPDILVLSVRFSLDWVREITPHTILWFRVVLNLVKVTLCFPALILAAGRVLVS